MTKWTEGADDKLIVSVISHCDVISHRDGGIWDTIAKWGQLGRSGKSCWERWFYYLRPGINRGPFTQQDEKKIVLLQQLIDNSWAEIATYLDGRTASAVKHLWNNNLKRRYSKVEENKLIRLQKLFDNRWKEIASFLPPQTASAIEDRWHKFSMAAESGLHPVEEKEVESLMKEFASLTSSGRHKRSRDEFGLDVDIDPFTEQEEDLIIGLQILFDDSWTAIARDLPGRSASEVAYHWYKHLKATASGRRPVEQNEVDSLMAELAVLIQDNTDDHLINASSS